MNIDEYLESLAQLARVARDRNIAVYELVDEAAAAADLVASALEFRQSILTTEDENWLGGYLATGFFSSRALPERLAAFAMALEIEREFLRLEIKRLCTPYSADQVLFRNVPKLFDNIRARQNKTSDLELIEVKAVRSVDNSEIYSAATGFTKLSPYLSPAIINWARTHWPNAPVFIRLDADFYSRERPLRSLTESTLVPANPRWLKNFSLRKGMTDFAAYELSDSGGHADSWDYHAKHMRRLEVRIGRRKDDYLAMMIEELPRPDDPSGLMVARCIHLDTRSPALTPLDKVEMQHLDLAINVYEGQDRRNRFDQRLQQGKVQDASFRTHLFRIEQTPFASLFGFCELFLESKVLLNEWLTDLRQI